MPSAVVYASLDVGVSANYHISPFATFPKGACDVEKQRVLTSAASSVGLAGSPVSHMLCAATSPLSAEALTRWFELLLLSYEF